MRRLAIGQYWRADSFVHRMDPRVKLVLMLLFVASLFFAKPPWGLLPPTLLLAATVAASKVPPGLVARACSPIVVFVVLTFVMNAAFGEGADLAGRLLGAAVLSWRILAIMLAGVLVALTTSPVELTDGSEALLSPLGRLGVPVHELAMMFTIAVRFVPILSDELRRIMTAQRARGAALDEGRPLQRAGVFVSMVVPLFASALRHAEGLADAMEARCYHGGEGRTHFHVLRIGKGDHAAMAVFVVYLAVLATIGLAL